MPKKRILVLVHQDLIPPEKIEKGADNEYAPWITEYDVTTGLKKLGHEVKVCGVYSDLLVIRKSIEEFKPHAIFNLLEEFDGEILYDQNVVSYLELLKVPYTGCSPRGLMLARDKALAKKVMSYHKIKTPQFQVFLRGSKLKLSKKLQFPLIVKCLYEEASYGLAKASVVQNEQKLFERIEYVWTSLQADVIVEEFIEGKEYYLGLLGQKKISCLPLWELRYENIEKPEKEFYSAKAKWNKKYRDRKGINSKKAQVDEKLESKIKKVCKRTYKSLGLNGYARIDLRVTNEGEIYVLEANPNPNLAMADEFAASAKHSGINYGDLLKKVLP